ncbi:MAG: thymidine phosphorylase [Clostridia bacterium]|nr:thymidine phosphorylase [Clostridia bacterium]
MRMYDMIYAKRHGEAHSDEDIREMIAQYVAGEIPDYQMSAWLMAVCFRGMDDRELSTLTDAMAHSGDTVDLSLFGDHSVDKHSTGGVGDKTSMVVAPLVAACGLYVAKMSGRGLGHTGGTVDKLTSFPGYSVTLSAEDFLCQAQNVGVAVIGQSGNLTPADKMLYALRDVTATVDCIPLIASSIMSKKLAAGAKSIVLDVKVGSGAFLQSIEEATELAQKMTAIGRRCGRQMAAVISDMDVPLGYYIGNILEVKEAIMTLKGEGPDDLRELCLTLASQMVSLGHGISLEEAQKLTKETLDSGKALEKCCEWIAGQGGDASFILHPEKFPEATCRLELCAEEEGYISQIDTTAIGRCAQILGAGRVKKEDEIDLTAGIRMAKKTGDYVQKGDLLAILETSRGETLKEAERCYREALTISAEKPEKRPLVFAVV